MKIHIVGAGVVGKATGRGFARFGHEIAYSDIDPGAHVRVPEAPFYYVTAGMFPDADFYFVCTPEDAAPGVVRQLAPVSGGIVIRSSVLPGTTAALSKELRRPLWHNPEFLREAVAEDDFLHTKYAILGKAHGGHPFGDVAYHEDELTCLYEHMGAEVVVCNSTESEFIKLITNAYLATQISFWNDIKKLTDAMGVNSHRIARIVALDPRVSEYGAYKHGAPYGGHCLPKDIAQLLKLRGQLADKMDLKMGRVHLIEAVKAINVFLGGE